MAAVSGHVAFSASVTTGSQIMASESNGSSVPFHNIISNAGNAYNGHTGVFTCHRDGDYVFMLNADVSHDFVTLHIHKNGQVIACAGRLDPSSTLLVTYVIVSLQAGDTVYVVQESPHGFIDHKGSAFSGFLLH
jgi:surface antigen